MNRLTRSTVFILAAVLGVLIALQFRTLQSGFKYVPLEQLSAISGELNRELATIEQYKIQIEEISAKIEEYESIDPNNQREVEKIIEDEILLTRTFAGLEDVAGQGIVVIINDAERELHDNEDPNNVLVHDVDIIRVVEDLRHGGAEAISINDQRVIFHKSKIYCNGPTILINEQLKAQPYVIKAIGDKESLEAIINEPGSYAQLLRQFGLFVEVNTSEFVEVEGYEGSTNQLYLKTKED